MHKAQLYHQRPETPATTKSARARHRGIFATSSIELDEAGLSDPDFVTNLNDRAGFVLHSRLPWQKATMTDREGREVGKSDGVVEGGCCGSVFSKP